MINILQEHIARYPLIQIQDIAKLLFQSEFGGGHMITDSASSLLRLSEEYRSLSNFSSNDNIESIGDGMERLYLSSLSSHLSKEVLNEFFVRSANHRRGTTEGLEKKIRQFLVACEENQVPFQKASCISFFESWKEKQYPAINHSDIYRNAYHPAYRVIESSYKRIYDVIMQIGNSERPLIVAIDGMCASGKTTLASLLHLNFPNSNLFHMDDYFLQPHQRTSERLSEIGGNIDYERFKEEVILHLTDPKGYWIRKYDCQTQTLSAPLRVLQKPLTIIEGVYSHHPYFGNAYDLRIFCEISPDEQRSRILSRNGEAMLQRFEKEWIPLENQYFKNYHIKEKSGLQ